MPRVLLLTLLLAASARASDPVPPPSDWVSAPVEGAVGDGNTSARDKYEFWDKLQDKAFDQLCKVVELQVEQELDLAQIAKVGGRYKRVLRRLPTGKLALVDEGRLKVDLRHDFPLAEFAETTLSVFIGSRLEGTSYIVRPLESEKSCSELDRLIDLRDVKTVLPLKPERFAKMAPGELWKLPLTLTASAGASASRVIDGLQAPLPISLSLSFSEQSRASVSLLRLSPEVLRFRLRLDQAELRDSGGSLLATIPAAQWGLAGGENILVKFLQHEAANLLNRYLAVTAAASEGRRQGTESTIEFLLDPNDPEEMAALARVLKGELNLLGSLGRMTARVKERLKKNSATRADLVAAETRLAEQLGGAASFAGLDSYERRSDSRRFRFPILVDLERTSSRDHDRMLLLDEDGGEFDVNRAEKRRHHGWFDLPLFGQLVKHDKQRSAQVFTYKDQNGQVASPVAVYIQQEGFLRRGDGLARSMAERADDVMRLAGAQGNGVNTRTALPIDTLFPQSDEHHTYQRGLTALTVAFNQKAVQDILHAGASAAVRAYANTLGGLGRDLMAWVAEHAVISETGEISYDRYALREAARLDGYTEWSEIDSALSVVKTACKMAGKIVRDLASARDAATPEAQAQAFLKLLTGRGESKLAYDEILKVIIQLADPLDLSAEFYTQVVKKVKGEQDISSRLVLREARSNDLLDAMSRARARFTEPSPLSD